MKNVSYSEKFAASNVSDSIINAFYFVLASIRWKLSAFCEIQWLHFTSEVDKFITVMWRLFRILCTKNY